jgi:hypothetical protein
VYRRKFLAGLGAAGTLSGCLSGPDETTSTAGTGGTPSGTPGPTEATTPTRETPTGGTAGDSAGQGGMGTGETTSLGAFGTPSTICEEELRPDSGIDAIIDPAFAEDWSSDDVDSTYRYDARSEGLRDEQTVIGLTTGEGARAYPLTVLNVHEVVNDAFGGPVLVTFCPLCRSGMVADRRLDGDASLFGVSGLLWRPERIQTEASKERNRTFGASATGGRETAVSNNGNLVIYDAATRSYWSQILARGICGPRAGTELEIVPSSVAGWGEWREKHPETEVLLPPPHSKTIPSGKILGADGETNGQSQ